MSPDDKTRIVRPLEHLQRPSAPDPRDREATRLYQNPAREEAPDPIHRPAAGPGAAPDDRKTRLFRPGAAARPDAPSFDPLAAARSAEPASDDPVVGWLVVVKGPGRGSAVRLGYGWNSIGRDASQRARIDFGDAQISRLNHAKLLYDPRGRKFTLGLGESTNPIYVRGSVVLGPTELANGDRVQLGDTELMLVALCGESFDWQDSAAE